MQSEPQSKKPRRFGEAFFDESARAGSCMPRCRGPNSAYQRWRALKRGLVLLIT